MCGSLVGFVGLRRSAVEGVRRLAWLVVFVFVCVLSCAPVLAEELPLPGRAVGRLEGEAGRVRTYREEKEGLAERHKVLGQRQRQWQAESRVRCYEMPAAPPALPVPPLPDARGGEFDPGVRGSFFPEVGP